MKSYVTSFKRLRWSLKSPASLIEIVTCYTGDNEETCPWSIEKCEGERVWRYWNENLEDSDFGGFDNPVLFKTLREARVYAELTE